MFLSAHEINMLAFQDACRSQGANLVPASSTAYDIRQGNSMGDVIELMALRLRRGYLPLINKPLNLGLLSQRMPDQLLGRMLNAGAQELLAPTEERDYPIGVERINIYGTCTDAESRWARTIQAMNRKTHKSPRAQIFLDGQGAPAVLRKGRGEATGILLQPARLGREAIEYPPGSIIYLQTDDSLQRGDGRPVIANRYGTAVSSTAAIQAMEFARLSAFSVSAEERPDFFNTLHAMKSHDIELADFEQGAYRQVRVAGSVGRQVMQSIGIYLAEEF